MYIQPCLQQGGWENNNLGLGSEALLIQAAMIHTYYIRSTLSGGLRANLSYLQFID